MTLKNKDPDSSSDKESENEPDENINSDNEEEQEGDEIEDNQSYIDDVENVATNNSKDDVLQRISLGGANTKIVLKKSTIKKPSTQKLVDEAIAELNEKRGSSMEAIRKFILNKNPGLENSRLNFSIKRYIQNSLSDGTMMQIKRSFKFTNKHELKIKEMKRAKLEAKIAKLKDKKSDKKKVATKKETITKKGSTSKIEAKIITKAKTENRTKETTKIPKLKKETKKTNENKIKAKIDLNLTIKSTSSVEAETVKKPTKEETKKIDDSSAKSKSTVPEANTATDIKTSLRRKKK